MNIDLVVNIGHVVDVGHMVNTRYSEYCAHRGYTFKKTQAKLTSQADCLGLGSPGCQYFSKEPQYTPTSFTFKLASEM